MEDQTHQLEYTTSGIYSYMKIELNSRWIEKFEESIKSIIRKGAGATFLKVIDNWNSLVIEYLEKYRDALDCKKLTKYEEWIKNIIKRSINSKMLIRYPAAIFYSPRSIGGLGMITMTDKSECEYHGSKHTAPTTHCHTAHLIVTERRKTTNNTNKTHNTNISRNSNANHSIVSSSKCRRITDLFSTWNDEIKSVKNHSGNTDCVDLRTPFTAFYSKKHQHKHINLGHEHYEHDRMSGRYRTYFGIYNIKRNKNIQYSHHSGYLEYT